MLLRTRQHTNERGGGVSAQAADQHASAPRCSPLWPHTRTSCPAPLKHPTGKCRRRSTSRPRPCPPRPGGRPYSRTTRRTRACTAGPRKEGAPRPRRAAQSSRPGPLQEGTAGRWRFLPPIAHQRCVRPSRRKCSWASLESGEAASRARLPSDGLQAQTVMMTDASCTPAPLLFE